MVDKVESDGLGGGGAGGWKVEWWDERLRWLLGRYGNENRASGLRGGRCSDG